MGDTILSIRLDALQDNLERVRNLELPDVSSRCWQLLQAAQFEAGTSTFVRDQLSSAVRDQAHEQLREVDSIRQWLKQIEHEPEEERQQHLLDAWAQYVEVQERCHEFFGECLELIGGLAFRSMSLAYLEDHIYQAADELLSECAKKAVAGAGQRTPTVPVVLETLIRKHAGVAGLRFPEWTIWTLPFTMHELGHVLIRRVRALAEFVNERTEQLHDRKKKKRTENHLYKFLADAFAMYTMGPAYACAMLLLGLNPLNARKDTDVSPADGKRAYVILKILERMNDVPEIVKPYTEIHAKLQQQWDDMLWRVRQYPALEEKDWQKLDTVIEDIWHLFVVQENIRKEVKYAHGTSGWSVAGKWKEVWEKQLKKPAVLEISAANMSDSNSLRDVLNAAWWCRLYNPDDKSTDAIADAACRLSQTLLKLLKESRERTSQRGPLRQGKGKSWA